MKKSYLILILILILLVAGLSFFVYDKFTLDANKFDVGKSDNHNDIWELTNSEESFLSRNLDGSIFSKSGVQWDRLRTEIPVNSNVQFDLMQLDGELSSYCLSLEEKDNTYLNGNGLNLINGSLNRWYHISLDVYSDHYVINANNCTETVNYANVNDSSVLFGFWLPENINTLKFKNFEVHPINMTN